MSPPHTATTDQICPAMDFLSTQQSSKKSEHNNNIVTINVGGRLFQTTHQTLTLAGPNSLLSTLSSRVRVPCDSLPPFIDRDPHMFSLLLSFLRTGTLPSKAQSLPFDLRDLIFEAQFYGLDSLLFSSLTNPSQFDPFTLHRSLLLPLNGRDEPNSVSTTSHGSIHVAHGSKITSFDRSLTHKSTILTNFSAIDSILAISPDVAAAGATDFSGLQILDLENGLVRESLEWENPTRSSSTVQAVGCSDQYLFTSFESSRRNSNTIMVFDAQGSFKPVSEIGRHEIYGAEIDSAVIPATKLEWVSSYNLLMASGSHRGPSGVMGTVRLWDVRSGNVYWKSEEKTDCFADITVSDNLCSIFKVGVNSGEVYWADLRKLGSNGNSWACLGDSRKGVLLKGKREGFGCKIKSYGNQVFCSKGSGVELWSEVLMGVSKSREDEVGERVLRKNLMGREKDGSGGKITNLEFGGNKMIVTRKDQQYVEVWKSSRRCF
ncbi:hypothetical protein Scep_004628 [Stephania cephalantha]|uniref:BTB/POZ domain-containing protein n=1 Tax=Stephania cephalantha TaxID=152367 RepID=A0AAP0KVP6_9MAGN